MPCLESHSGESADWDAGETITILCLRACETLHGWEHQARHEQARLRGGPGKERGSGGRVLTITKAMMGKSL